MKCLWGLIALGVVSAGCKKDEAPSNQDRSAREETTTSPTMGSAAPVASAVPSAVAKAADADRKSARPVWDAFVAKHPETKGLMTLLPADHRTGLAGFGRANLPAGAEEKDLVGKPAFVVVFPEDLEARGQELWFPTDKPLSTWSGTLTSVGENAGRKAVVKHYGGNGHNLIVVETPDKLVQGAFFYEGSGAAGYPFALRVVESRDKKQAIVVAYLGGNDRDDAYDETVFAFAGGQFKPVLLLPTDGGRPGGSRSCKDVEGIDAPLCTWVPPLPVLQSTGTDPLRLSVWKPNTPACQDYAACNFSQQQYKYDEKSKMLVADGQATEVKRALQPLK